MLLLPPCHQNWRISPELRNRDIYSRHYTQTLFLDRIRLDGGDHISISSISDHQSSSLASELTSFCAWLSAPLVCSVLFGCTDSVQDALLYLRCGCVPCMPHMTSDEFLFSWELRVMHSPSNDVLAAWRHAGKNVSSCHDGPSFDFSSWLCGPVFSI